MTDASLQTAQAALARFDFGSARRAAVQVLRERPSNLGANGVVALDLSDAETAKEHVRLADSAAPGQAHVLKRRP